LKRVGRFVDADGPRDSSVLYRGVETASSLQDWTMDDFDLLRDSASRCLQKPSVH
jgi:hypothetical protein